MRRTLAQIAQIAGIADTQRYRDGGHVRGPGTDTSDSVNIKASNGEFILPTDTVRKVGVRRLRDLVHMTHEPSGKSPSHGRYADGGLIDENKKPNSFGDAAAVAQVPGTTIVQPPAPAQAASVAPPPPVAPAQPPSDPVSQIPTGGLKAPAADGSQDSWANTETGRNLSNIASALPGSLGGALPRHCQNWRCDHWRPRCCHALDERWCWRGCRQCHSGRRVCAEHGFLAFLCGGRAGHGQSGQRRSCIAPSCEPTAHARGYCRADWVKQRCHP